MVVNTTIPSVTPSNQFRLPLTNVGTLTPIYKFRVDWGDGKIDKIKTFSSTAATHTYISGGTYTIKIYGRLDRLYFNLGGDRLKLINVNQWGSVIWKNFSSSFYGCSNFSGNTANDTPHLIKVSDMSNMFYLASKFNHNINDWDVSYITNTLNMFRQAQIFNQPLSGWNVSNITNMNSMFYDALKFNQNIENWNVGKVTNMGFMFFSTFGTTPSFNQPLNNWNVSAVTNMVSMFSNSKFNQPLSGWNVSNVINMSGMFEYTTNFNQNIEKWDVGKVTNMTNMFAVNPVFNQPLNSWDVSKVNSLAAMFQSTTQFNQPLNSWNVSNVINMGSMFDSATNFNQRLDNWNVSAVTSMGSILVGTNLSTLNYDLLLTGWTGWVGGVPTKSVQSNVIFDTDAKYTSSNINVLSARTYLDITKAWTITDGGGI